jgi:hypothetical protein
MGLLMSCRAKTCARNHKATGGILRKMKSWRPIWTRQARLLQMLRPETNKELLRRKLQKDHLQNDKVTEVQH